MMLRSFMVLALLAFFCGESYAESRTRRKRAPQSTTSADGKAPEDSSTGEKEKEEVRTVTIEKKLHLAVGTDFFYLKNNNAELSGIGLGVSGSYSFSPKTSVGLGFRHGFGVKNGINSALSEIDIKFTLALSGAIRPIIVADLLGKKVLKAKLTPASGMRAQVNIGDYLLYGSTKISSLVGAGLGLYYEIGTKSMLSFLLGARAEYLSGTGDNRLIPITVWTAVSLPL